jgi:hypothetical protein
LSLLLLLGLLPEALRLSRKARELLLQRSLSKSRGLRSQSGRLGPQSGLEALGLLERLLLAILRLSWAGAIRP